LMQESKERFYLKFYYYSWWYFEESCIPKKKPSYVDFLLSEM
jgi:hypothetical protein